MTHTFHLDGSLPSAGEIFVFGSNEAGRHGSGAAKVAKIQFGARYGVGRGPTGHSYAIPTKTNHPTDPYKLVVLPLATIQKSVEDFLLYATLHPEKSFFVTRIGCVLAGYSNEEIGVLFARAPLNCNLPQDWKMFVKQHEIQAVEVPRETGPTSPGHATPSPSIWPRREMHNRN